MKPFTILVGKSASGKDTILQQVLKVSKSFNPIVSTTSRPKRDNEKEGVDYYYVSKSSFLDLINDNQLIEYRTYDTLVGGIKDTWYYGLQKKDLDLNKKYIVILDLDGARSFIDYYGSNNCRVCYIYCYDEKRKERAKKRPNFDEQEWNRRFEADKKDLSLSKFSAMFRDTETLIFDNIEKNDYKDIAVDIVTRR